MMKLLFTFFIILFTGCSGLQQLRYTEEKGNGVSDIIKSMTHAGEYNPGMHTGDTFLFFIPQGIPFGLQNITDLQQSGKAISGDIRLLDNLYLFSGMVNRLLICDTTAFMSARTLEDLYSEDRDLFRMTSPTYNGSFLPSAPYPLITDTARIWTSVTWQTHHYDTIENRNGKIQVIVPCRNISGKFSFFHIARPWIGEDMPNICKSFYPRTAVIEGLILARDLRIQIREESCKIKIYGHKKKYRIMNRPDATVIKYPDTIIGYYCRIL